MHNSGSRLVIAIYGIKISTSMAQSYASRMRRIVRCKVVTAECLRRLSIRVRTWNSDSFKHFARNYAGLCIGRYGREC
jgi:hypothetical protein